MGETAVEQVIEDTGADEGVPDAQGFLWARAEHRIASCSWSTLGILKFPDAGADEALLVVGAVGAKEIDHLLLWCPSIHTGWLPVSKFVEAAKGIQFAGQHAVWAKNVGNVDFDAIVRVRFKQGITGYPSAPDATVAYYASQVWKRTNYCGILTLKHPCDLWVMQEILHDVRPDLVVETGTFHGGSALYYAHVLDALGHGRVMTVDVEQRKDRPRHPRILAVEGSSLDEHTLKHVAAHAAGGRVLVVLDSDHSYEHVLAELRTYAPLVSSGSYLVCEDTNTPGPAEAVRDFLASPEGSSFVADKGREKFGTTMNKGGFLYKPAIERGE